MQARDRLAALCGRRSSAACSHHRSIAFNSALLLLCCRCHGTAQGPATAVQLAVGLRVFRHISVGQQQQWQPAAVLGTTSAVLSGSRCRYAGELASI